MNENPPQGWTIRPVTLDDVPEMIDLYNRTSLLAHPVVSHHDEAEFLLRVEEYRQQQVPLLAGCLASGQMMGWAGYLPLRTPWDTSCTVELFGHPDLGAWPVIEALITIARAQGKHSAIMQVEAGNERLTHLCDRMGFRRAGYLKQAIDIRGELQRRKTIAYQRGIDPGPDPESCWHDLVQYQLLLAEADPDRLQLVEGASKLAARKVYVLPGERIVSNETFGEVIGEVINGLGGYFGGGGLDSLNDCLRGGFGTPDEPYTIVWLNSAASREAMGYDYTVHALRESLHHAHSSGEDKILAEIERAKRHEGPTEFDKIVDIIHKALRPELILL